MSDLINVEDGSNAILNMIADNKLRAEQVIKAGRHNLGNHMSELCGMLGLDKNETDLALNSEENREVLDPQTSEINNERIEK